MRIKTHPLTGRITPPIMLAPDGAEGGGGTVVAEPRAPMGKSFTGLSRSLKGEAPAAPPEGGEQKPPEQKPTPEPKPQDPPPQKKVEAPPGEKKPAAKGAAAAMPEEIFKEIQPIEKKEAAPAPPEELSREELTKGMSDAGRKNFARLEDHYKGKLTKLETEIVELKKSPVTPVEIEEAKALKSEHEKLKKEHAEMLKTVELIGMERSPQFQAKYIAGRQKLVEEAAKKVLNAGGSPDKFKEALALQGRAKYDAIEEALNDAPGFIANQIAAVVTQIETLDEEKTQALQNASGKLTEWGAEETARQKEENEKLAKARETRFSELLPELAKDCIFLRRLPDDVEGAGEWNAVVEDVAEKGKNFLFTASNFDEFAGAAIKAQAYDKLQGIFFKVREENIALHKQVAEMTGSEPGGSGSGAGGGGNGGGGGGDQKPLTFAERVKKGLDSSGSGS